jgi:hypothetical protein
MSVELFRYRGAANNDGTPEYVFERHEQVIPKPITKKGKWLEAVVSRPEPCGEYLAPQKKPFAHMGFYNRRSLSSKTHGGRSIRRKSNGYRRSQDKVLRRGTANPGSGPRRGGGNRTRQIAVAGRSLNKIAEHTRKAESTFNQMAKATRRNFHEIGEDTASAWIDERKSIRATSTLGNRQPAEPRSQPQSSICIVRVSASLRRVKREWRASGFQDSADNASFGP